ncbi:MAG: trypsin-like peptidase domain-containing protein [Bacteroidales bacterium]|nr:trypsin-like peptidase domain-containing protein [Bacteroidales bacterium]
MKTFVKSFLGAASGTVLIVVSFALFFHFDTQEPGRDNTRPGTLTENSFQQIPVHRTAYTIPQNIDFTEAAEKSINAVVHIKTEISAKTGSYESFFGPFKDYFGNPYRNNTYIAFGSGVIISPDGYIVTNNHVVEGADRISVTFNNKKELEARLVGTDPTTDLALVKVDASDLVFLTYGNSDEVKIGEWVLAVGNPFNLTSTVTAGIVSAKARNMGILGAQSSIESFIQTDAVVNRGNSGGALVNTRGELVGINAAIASHTGVYEGYSFAIPVNIVKKVIRDLMDYGEIQRAFIGVQIRDIDAEFAAELGLKEVEGVYIAGIVPNGGADNAGLVEGDVIVSIDDVKIHSLSELMGSIGQHSPGEVVSIDVNRNNEIQTFSVTLKNENGTTAIVRGGDTFNNELLGASLQQLSKDELQNLNIGNGLKITEVSDGILKRGGITRGFIITEINGLKVHSSGTLNDALQRTQRNIVQLKGMYPNGVRIAYEFML